MAGRKIAEVGAVQRITSTMKIPASTGNGNAATMTVGALSDFITGGIDIESLQVPDLDIQRIDYWTDKTTTSGILSLATDEGQLIYSVNMDGAGRIYETYLSANSLHIRQVQNPKPSTLYLYGSSSKTLRGYSYYEGALHPWALKKDVEDAEDELWTGIEGRLAPEDVVSIPINEINSLFS